MRKKLGASVLVGIFVLLGTQACIFGGGGSGGGKNGVPSRQGAIPTATLPATMTDPIVLSASDSSKSGGTETNSSGITSTTTYTVQPGDTLGAIATAQGVPAEQQAAWIAQVEQLNNLSDPRLLKAGDELILPVTQATTPAPQATGTKAPQTAATPISAPQVAATRTPATAAATATPTTSAGSSGRTYTVKSGDYPYLIAQTLGVPDARVASWVNELVSLNNIDPNNLTVGQVLELPADTP